MSCPTCGFVLEPCEEACPHCAYLARQSVHDGMRHAVTSDAQETERRHEEGIYHALAGSARLRQNAGHAAAWGWGLFLILLVLGGALSVHTGARFLDYQAARQQYAALREGYQQTMATVIGKRVARDENDQERGHEVNLSYDAVGNDGRHYGAYQWLPADQQVARGAKQGSHFPVIYATADPRIMQLGTAPVFRSGYWFGMLSGLLILSLLALAYPVALLVNPSVRRFMVDAGLRLVNHPTLRAALERAQAELAVRHLDSSALYAVAGYVSAHACRVAPQWRLRYALPNEAGYLHIAVMAGHNYLTSIARECPVPPDPIAADRCAAYTQALRAVLPHLPAPASPTDVLFIAYPAAEYLAAPDDYPHLPDKPSWLVATVDAEDRITRAFFVDPQTLAVAAPHDAPAEMS